MSDAVITGHFRCERDAPIAKIARVYRKWRCTPRGAARCGASAQ